MDLLILDRVPLPSLRAPALLCAFSGWPDGGAGPTGAISYLLMKWPHQRIAHFDPEQVYAYTLTRPRVRLSEGGLRSLVWPELLLASVPLASQHRDLVVLAGPEPDLRWHACASTITEIAGRLGVEIVITLGCFLAPVSHVGAVPLVGFANDPDLSQRLRTLSIGETAYQGPTAFNTAVVDAATRAGLSATSIWAAAPNYLATQENAKVSAALLTAVERLLDLDLGLAELHAAGRAFEERVDEVFRQRPDLWRSLERLRGHQPETAEPPAERGAEEAQPSELPSPQDLVQELEEFLRQLRDKQQDEE